jgi:hypothetical protein
MERNPSARPKPQWMRRLVFFFIVVVAAVLEFDVHTI